ncbi:MAG: hydroxyacid dehydrogenase, partial [Lachnospiraceae bacterium]|nr:hydroxyacid dehydrogenase [Lachnospiraceae bacterium]
MKIVMVERNSVGTDIDVSCYERFGEVVYYPQTTAEEAAEHIGDADIVISNKLLLNEQTLKACPNVKLICNTATGFDNIDLNYCNKRGITVTNVRDYSTQSVAQHTFALLFYLLEKLKKYDEYVKSGQYMECESFSYFGY